MSWPIVKLGDITEVITKGTTPTSVGFKFTEIGINFIKVESITSNGQFIPNKFALISDDCHETLKRSQLKVGDVLFSIAGALGRTALVTSEILPANTNQALAIIRLKAELPLNKRYLQLALMTGITMEQVEKHKGGVAQQNLSLSQLKSFEIPLPPIPEQKRIVAILDQAFADIEHARAKTEQNLRNARELFESYLQQVFSQRGKGWVTATLGDILTDKPRNGWSPPAKNHSDHGIPVLTLSAVTGFEFNKHKIKFTSASTKENAHYWANNGDLLITRSNTPGLVGHVAICSNIETPTIYPDLIMKLKLDIKKVEIRFIYYQLRSEQLRKIVMNSAQGANPTMKKINQKIVLSLPIKYPSIKTQEKLVIGLDSIYEASFELERIYQNKLNRLNELKKSILHLAFTGQLTHSVGPAEAKGAAA